MPLPSTQRVVFERNPLLAVVAQVKFPPILKIVAEPPVLLQDRIREAFPGYALVNQNQLGLPNEVPQEIQKTIQAVIASQTNMSFGKVHQFSTADDNWLAHVGNDSFVLFCKVYPRWEVFREKFAFVWNAVQETYSPAFANSVGLRYQNAIDRGALGLEGVPWKALLAPFIASQFVCDGVEEREVLSAFHRFELLLDNRDKVHVQHGTAFNQGTKAPVYAIDNSFITTTKVNLEQILTRLDELNGRSGSFFRLCITDELYGKLVPTAI